MKTIIRMVALVGAALAFTAAAQTNSIVTNVSLWKGSVAAGVTLTRGNSDTLLVTINAEASRKWLNNELLLEGDGTYGEDNGNKNAESLHGSAQFNRLITERFYWGVKLDGLTDEIADIDYRLTLAPLAGYYFIKTDKNMLAGEVGPAEVLQKLGSNGPQGYTSLRFAERYEHKFSATARLWQNFEILPQVDRFNNYYMDGEIGVETALTKTLSLRTYLDDTYYNIPAHGRKKNDLKLVAAIAYKF